MKSIKKYWTKSEMEKREAARKAASARKPNETDEDWQSRVREDDETERRQDAAFRRNLP